MDLFSFVPLLFTAAPSLIPFSTGFAPQKPKQLRPALRMSNATNCWSCVTSGGGWCLESSRCDSLQCSNLVTDLLNCPRRIRRGFEYNDGFARNVAMPIISAVHANKPIDCLSKYFPRASVFSIVEVDCSQIPLPLTTCFAFTAVDPDQRAIFVSFRGTTGPMQLGLELSNFVLTKNQPFFDIGYVFTYFNDAFKNLWNGGLGRDTMALKRMYPDWDIWVFGYSLGGAEASLYASHLVKAGIYSPERIRLLTIGQPRTGDKTYAKWHDETFPYSYRVVHAQDIVPHVPPQVGENPLWHHRHEVWYNNEMKDGDQYTICRQSDGQFCSGKGVNWNVLDHLFYFNKKGGVIGWGNAGCPRQ